MTKEKFNERCDSLYAKGRLVKKLSEDGEPLMESDFDHEPTQVWIADIFATPAELAFWREEHGQYVN